MYSVRMKFIQKLPRFVTFSFLLRLFLLNGFYANIRSYFHCSSFIWILSPILSYYQVSFQYIYFCYYVSIFINCFSPYHYAPFCLYFHCLPLIVSIACLYILSILRIYFSFFLFSLNAFQRICIWRFISGSPSFQ